VLSFFKLGLYNSAFVIDGLETTLNTGQKGYIYREVLKGSYYIKVLRVLQTIPNYLGNVSIGGIEEVGKYFACVY
jgi:hypothetical protein